MLGPQGTRGTYTPPYYPRTDDYGNPIEHTEIIPGETRSLRDLSPEARRDAQAHEVGHEVDKNRVPGRSSLAASDRYIAGLSKREAAQIEREHRLIAREWYEADWTSGANPRLAPDVSRKRAEYLNRPTQKFARAVARYGSDPESMKRLYPATAKMVRTIWNSLPRAAQEAIFNQLVPGLLAAGSAGAMLGGGDDAKAAESSGGPLNQQRGGP